MKFGTIVYDNEIYNLDYMTSDDVKKVLIDVEENKKKNMIHAKNVESE